MSRFFLLLWLRWAIRLSIESVLIAFIISTSITTYIYFKQGYVTFTPEVLTALFTIVKFWFGIIWSVSILLSLFRGMKYIFNRCHSGLKLELLSCPKESKSEVIDIVGYGDLVKVWRKWFLLLIWLVASEMVLTLMFFYILGAEDIFEWFSIWVLYLFIIVAGYFSFMILSAKCKRIRLNKC